MTVCRRPPIHVDLTGYHARVAENWRQYGAEYPPVFNINGIDPECPYGREENFNDDTEDDL